MVPVNAVAGDLAFLQKIQKQIDQFVWNGKPRVDRQTVTQSKAKGGLGLLSVQEQYRAIVGNLMLWIMGPGSHPLQIILRSHIGALSEKKWGIPDLAWLVTRGNCREVRGSAPWRNICQAWVSLKPLLPALPPQNFTEWKALPLWRPHYNHVDSKKVNCSSRAFKELRLEGLVTMGDIISLGGDILPWVDLPPRIMAIGRQRAYQKLTANEVDSEFKGSSDHRACHWSTRGFLFRTR